MTLDEARLMANVNGRAQRLFEDGYRAFWTGAGRLKVRSARGTVYAVDTGTGACDCPFYRAHRGRHACKHCLGWRRLLIRQRACHRMVALLLLRAWADVMPQALLDRHVCGDWGELDEDDCQANGQALSMGARLLSAYALPDGVRVRVITEADHSATTLLLPEEY